MLPHVSHESKRSRWGTARHAFLEQVNTIGRTAALEQVEDEFRPLCEMIDFEQLPLDPKAFAPEVSLAYNVLTGNARELGRGLNRQYVELERGEIPGTADLLGIAVDHVFVGDYKGPRSSESHAPPAPRNPQMKFLALAATTVFGKPAARVELIHMMDDGRPWRSPAFFDGLALDTFAAELLKTWESVEHQRQLAAEGKPVQLSEGPWCEYCPAFNACPAKKTLALALGSEPSNIEEELRGMLNERNALVAYERLMLARKVLARVDDALHAYAKEHPFTLRNGNVFGPTESRREFVRGDVAFDYLSERFGLGVARSACSMESNKTALRDALRPVATSTGAKITKLAEETLDALRSRGGVEVKVSRGVKEHRPELTE